jgi:alkanesulfonate monooxygenase SsuD/methylene tetrahydromethanopterin reductase-like flavin-dependent oxidoreductase (luciferase family)
VDQPIPEDRIPKSANFHKGFFDDILRLMQDGTPTLRDVYLRYERGRKTIAGGPRRIADLMEEWFTGGAADGFMLQFHIMPHGLEMFVDRVVPELQRRGLMRSVYTGTTLREHMGLQRPARGARNPQPTE